MLEYDEKRNYIRMDVDCDIQYKAVDSDNFILGRCTNLSGAGLSFIAENNFQAGTAMEVSIVPKSNLTPPMIAYIEVVRCTSEPEGGYQVAASIKSIKGN